MKILIIGSGGREHAIGWKLVQTRGVELFFAPGNGGTDKLGVNIDIDAGDINRLADFAKSQKIDMTVVGPELPLTLGIADEFKKHGLRIFGPGKEGAQLEGSKAFAKKFMRKYNIPTAEYNTVSTLNEGLDILSRSGFPLVIKADGLAAGKGVMICTGKSEAETALQEIMESKIFGEAGSTVVIEEFLQGKEVSLLCFTDGETIIPMEPASDYKRALDNDEGANTGGMGSISPSPYYTPGLADDIVQKTLEGIKKEGFDYCGVIYIGLILTPDGPKVLEYNARFGDPETEALLPRLDSDLVSIMEAVIDKQLEKIRIKWSDKKAVSVVLTSHGYPGVYETGYPVVVPETESIVFHAGTIKKDGQIVTCGGRVLAVTAMGESFDEARQIVYADIKKIDFKGNTYRSDIGQTVIKRANGKTKDLYEQSDGNFLLKFKDDMTGVNGIFDPGANEVGLTVEGAGLAGLVMSEYYFKLLEEKGYATHFISTAGNTMTIKPAVPFMGGLEVICRYKAMGSFIRRYGGYISEGSPLDAVVEMTLKDDLRGDPPANDDTLIALNILKPGEYTVIKTLMQDICAIIKADLEQKNMELCDIKLEFGKDKNGKIMLIDEVSGGNMRVFENGRNIHPLELSKKIVKRTPEM